MPRGDRELLKADTDDGYTKVANLLLEALALAKLSGVQKGICLFLWRRTYGWGTKEDQIALREFAQACDTSEPYVSRQIKQLVNWGIIIRVTHESGKIPTYTFNTRVAQWDKGCINVQGLHECEIQGLYKCTIQGLHERTRVEQPPALEPQEVEPPLKKGLKKYKEISTTAPDAREAKNIYSLFEQEFGRPLSPIEIEQILDWEKRYSPDLIAEALKRAVLQGVVTVKYVGGILSAWDKSNVRSLMDVKRQDQEFEKRKETATSGQARYTGETRRVRGDPTKDRGSGQKSKFENIDFSKFYYKPDAGEDGQV